MKYIFPLTIIIMLVIIISSTTLIASAEEPLIVAMMKYIKNPNPLKEETWYDWWLNIITFDRLFRADPNLDPAQWLAVYYEISGDGLSWTIGIVDNAYWHDGVPLTVKDIAFTIDFYKKYKPPAWYPNVEVISNYEIIDDYTIKLRLEKPFVWFKMRFGYMIILPEHIWKYVEGVFSDPQKFNPLSSDDVSKVLSVIKAKAPGDVASKVEDFVNKYGHLRIGSGPFMLVRWKEGELLEMMRAPNYFKSGFPKIERLIYKVYKTADAQYLAVKTGEAHFMVWTVPYAVIKEAEENPNIVLPKAPDTYIGFIGLNMKDSILSNKLVRKALAYAIDRNYIVKTLMLGYAEPVYSYIHPGLRKWVNLDIPRYDELNFNKANELLDEAGLKDVDNDGIRETSDGKDVELTILTPSYDPVRVRIGDVMVEWFKKIGIKLNNRPIDFDTLIDEVYNKHTFQLYIIENDANFQPWYYSSIYTKEQYVKGGENPWGFINDEFEALLKQADAEINEDKRINLYYKMQGILADELPLIPLYVRYWMQAHTSKLSGIVLMPGGALNFWTLINANFKGIKPEIPITPFQKPTPTTSPSPTPSVKTITETKTVKETSTITSTFTSIVTRIDWTITGILAILMLIIGLGVGYAIKR